MSMKNGIPGPTLLRYRFGEDAGAWVMKYYVQWPLGFSGWKQVTNTQMKEIAREHIASCSSHDEQYIQVESANNEYITFLFDVEKWIAESFLMPLSTSRQRP